MSGDCVIQVIKKGDLKDISEKQGDIFMDIASSLARKHYFNIEKIKSINLIIIEQELNEDESEKEMKKKRLHNTNLDILSLKQEVTGIYESKGADFLNDLVEGFD